MKKFFSFLVILFFILIFSSCSVNGVLESEYNSSLEYYSDLTSKPVSFDDYLEYLDKYYHPKFKEFLIEEKNIKNYFVDCGQLSNNCFHQIESIEESFIDATTGCLVIKGISTGLEKLILYQNYYMLNSKWLAGDKNLQYYEIDIQDMTCPK